MQGEELSSEEREAFLMLVLTSRLSEVDILVIENDKV